MSVSIVLDGENDLARILKKLDPLINFNGTELMTAIGAIGESQTRRRISEEKTAPDGTPWKPNGRGGDILVESGQHLLASISFNASDSQVEWGAAWEYAHVHQYGATIKPKGGKRLVFSMGGSAIFAKEVNIPARPFVGLSPENEREILDIITDNLGVLQ